MGIDPASQTGIGEKPTHAKVVADADRVFQTVLNNGVAIIPLDVAYAIVAMRAEGIRRIFSAKNRSYEKPSGMFGSWELSREIHRMDNDRHQMARTIVEEEDLPFSVVAPFSRDHQIFDELESFVLENSSKEGTLDMLLNAGPLHNEIARQSKHRNVPLFGSSANTSLAGSKYRYSDIEDVVRAAADFHLDYGLSKYANEKGRSSTIIDFRDFTVLRIGVCFDRLVKIFKDRFNVELIIDARTAQ